MYYPGISCIVTLCPPLHLHREGREIYHATITLYKFEVYIMMSGTIYNMTIIS